MPAGVGLGGLPGPRLCYRAVPVAAAPDDPVAPGRWGLIAIHVGLGKSPVPVMRTHPKR